MEALTRHLVQGVVEPVPPLLERVRVVQAHVVQPFEREGAAVGHSGQQSRQRRAA